MLAPVFRNLCDVPKFTEQRKRLRTFWRVFEPYADRHFAVEIRKDFQQRFWEMYLAWGLLGKGFSLRKNTGKAPDLCLDCASRPHWVECIVPKAGSGDDAVPEMGSNSQLKMPNSEILLRYTSAISEKHCKYEGYLKKRIVAQDEPFIIAVNGACIPYVWSDENVPRIVKALYGIGDQCVVLNPRTGTSEGEGHLMQPERRKKSERSLAVQS
ncbi:MAG TPA: hypothetical protein PK468_18865 [Candidatus Hydrogenedentes bacterium]|nr:hypothetical protein [Candidatus Hydrogenedentota bacterium]